MKIFKLCGIFEQVSILDTGEVCMELLKGQGAQERVKEVLRISCDGSMVRDRNTVVHTIKYLQISLF